MKSVGIRVLESLNSEYQYKLVLAIQQMLF